MFVGTIQGHGANGTGRGVGGANFGVEGGQIVCCVVFALHLLIMLTIEADEVNRQKLRLLDVLRFAHK